MIISIKKLKKAIFIVMTAVIVGVATLIFFSFENKNQQLSEQIYTDNYSKISFLNLCGWKVEENPIEEQEIIIPEKFNETFKQYNELQKLQGYDLSRYKGKQAVKYTYEVTNYPNYMENIRAVLLVIDGKIIGGDIHSAELNGFMTGLNDETLF